jgi:hypothetical protein
LRKLWIPRYTLDEGVHKSALFDLAVRNYDAAGNELFVEVKSSVEVAHVRMAVGQLYSYWYALKGKKTPHLAVVLPKEPNNEIKAWLDWLEIGLLWFDGSSLTTETKWLRQLCIQ